MEQTFLNFAARVMGVDANELTLGTAYKDYPPWDSLMFLRLVMEAEEEYGVSIPMESFDGLCTLGDFYRLVSGRAAR